MPMCPIDQSMQAHRQLIEPDRQVEALSMPIHDCGPLVRVDECCCCTAFASPLPVLPEPLGEVAPQGFQ